MPFGDIFCPMPRDPRIEFENAWFRIVVSGKRRESVVFDEDDRRLFVKTLPEAAKRH